MNGSILFDAFGLAAFAGPVSEINTAVTDFTKGRLWNTNPYFTLLGGTMRHFWTATTAAVLLSAGTSIAGAQTCTGNPCTVQVTASATVNDVLRLTLSSATTSLGTPTEADYDAGYKDAAGPTASVKSNRPWHVDVSGAAASFTYTGSLTNPNKPAGSLLWGTVSGTYGNNMGASAVLASGTTGTGNASQAIFLRTLWAWATDVPGSYDLVINFTLAAP